MITAQDLGALGGVAALIAVAFGIAATGERKPRRVDIGRAAVRQGLPLGPRPTGWKPRASVPGLDGGWMASAGRVSPGSSEIEHSAFYYNTKRAADVGAKRLAARLNAQADA